MSQQAQNEYYGDEARWRWTSPTRSTRRSRDLFAAGADIVQLDEPWLQSRAEQARELRASPAINRALDGVAGTTALHTCFGYAARRARPAARLPVPRRAGRLRRRQLAIEAAQPQLDLAVLDALAGQDHRRSACSTSPTPEVETPEDVAERIRRALDVRDRPSGCRSRPDCGMKYLPRDVAFGKLRALVEGARVATGRA